MLQRLNKMFMGEVNASSNQEPEFSEKEDDEWILVDFIDTCADLSAEEEEEEEEEEEDLSEESPAEHASVFSCLPASLECLADTSDSCFLQFESCPMEESWFITPPPCFTAGGLTAIKVETSPMENLLIEHPSMSVYAVHASCPGLSEASCGTEGLHDPTGPRCVPTTLLSMGSLLRGQEKLLIRLTDTEVEAQEEVEQHTHCYVAALAAHTTLLEQSKSFRPSQWIKEHSEKQSLNRNSLRRQNLTRDCHSRQGKHSGWVVHQPCPRQYNY
nr:tumor protein p53-inducible nuclear protein 1 isoform X1 [Oryctolagus cuniculus]XP_051700596.1 tumor protein p53-inducible nuclear protein 1 isoform X1 [Oryctolagus cuniculus]XP_051700597.1 tumor protein p53-inducible nuclear protein 1 isoform X1 [Oryctolagus cuniculus]XP_051700598.1 tumor protein p53-inducible nuclear protein 1 isoform X1 [Oryctolagus cuniculus]XP_051700600.1 tumor protein p53-inducible nuclear protein 1 isoform X1 [Oryctolagus cuniculus]XP_051700601.1 tumor protein p53-in